MNGEPQSPSSEQSRSAVAFSALRIAVGILFLIFGEYKVFGRTFTLGGGFQGWIHRFLTEGAAYPFMVPVLEHFVLDHGTAIAFLVAYGELAIGLALTLGVVSRLASAFGLVYMLTLLFSSNYPGPQAPLWQYFGASLDHLVLALCFAAFIVGDPDQALSVWRHVQSWRRSRTTPAVLAQTTR
jgi:thiosulfate dehydrogenase [quinone] large subunit